MGVKRLTCFAIKIQDEKIKSELIKQLQEFDNHPENREDI